MIKQLIRAYNSGWRAGMSDNIGAECPYYKRKQFFKRAAWYEGWVSGKKELLLNWLIRQK